LQLEWASHWDGETMKLLWRLGARGGSLIFLVLLMGGGRGVPGLQAQTDSAAPRKDALGLRRELGRVPSGKTIRIETRSSQLHTGRLADFDAVMLRLESEDSRLVNVPLDEIRSLRVRGRSTKTGAVIGGVAGLAFGVLAGVFVAKLADEDGDPEYASAVAGVGAFFTVVGAGTGAIVGSAIPKWRLKWP